MTTPAQDLNDKLRLEAQLRPEIERYNKDLVRKFAQQWGRFDTVPDFSARDDLLSSILLRHYERTGEVFDSRIRGGLPELVAITPTEDTEIAAALALFFFLTADSHAQDLNMTNREDANDAVSFARREQESAAEGGGSISRLEAAAIAAAALNRKLSGRISGIVATETQLPAEAAKATEAEVLSGLLPSVTGGSPRKSMVNKEWVSVGDSRVREDHLTADGQTRKVGEPFNVGGESLRWPGDRSLGASAGNVINCRCNAGYDEQGIIAARELQERDR